MVFIGVTTWDKNQKKGNIININTKYIKIVNETEMTVTLDDNTIYRIDGPGLDIFLAAIYGNEE